MVTDDQWHDALLGPVFQQNLVGIAIDEAHCLKIWQVFFFGVCAFCHTFAYYCLLFITGHRGETFREAFSEIRCVRSLTPEHVRMMALTATAIKSTRTFVCHRLGMAKPSLVLQAPNRPNIKYIVHPNPDTFEEMFLSLVETS